MEDKSLQITTIEEAAAWFYLPPQIRQNGSCEESERMGKILAEHIRAAPPLPESPWKGEKP